MQGIERNYRAIGPSELAQLAGLAALILIPCPPLLGPGQDPGTPAYTGLAGATEHFLIVSS